jgi:hypothetical protein
MVHSSLICMFRVPPNVRGLSLFHSPTLQHHATCATMCDDPYCVRSQVTSRRTVASTIGGVDPIRILFSFSISFSAHGLCTCSVRLYTSHASFLVYSQLLPEGESLGYSLWISSSGRSSPFCIFSLCSINNFLFSLCHKVCWEWPLQQNALKTKEPDQSGSCLQFRSHSRHMQRKRLTCDDQFVPFPSQDVRRSPRQRCVPPI